MRPLDCVVQEYAWGHPTWIPDLVDQPERRGRPNAELWMGAHPSGPSRVGDLGLDELVESAPDEILGASTNERFGQLPFLFKVLAIDQALSIQTHPSATQAAAGFAREEREGVPVGAPNRTYCDPNHKPELLCALTSIEALCGFRPLAEALDFLDTLEVEALTPLRTVLASGEAVAAADAAEADALAAGLHHLLRLSSADVEALLAELLPALADCEAPTFVAAAQALARVAEDHPGDVGVAVGLLLNHVVLEPGQALFLGPGNLHAYLDGVGVELMANSDNVIRGGLTGKHIDLDELLAVVDCTPLEVPVETADEPVHTFAPPVEEFQLTRVDLDDGATHTVAGPAIVLLTTGRAGSLAKGRPVFVAASDPPLELEGSGLAWVASVGAGS